ncbi:hypothetical protein ABB37_05014 [Leptomonas pyrrhocoris]|uniref:Uncharacterized protein n=1 Tax=Leptomonas pyrrhocoris TaxID=157538 RepID=A0A0M9G0L2_LEPPY|nr:hypothetical protein ABB37_05014 [Leptomonas pyrrhocoris]KPA79970.1 hypothetical protein ABB37_05014 [Leptomonas pyrrhocoris]|eukprot:XP_015658409.1 hypothetical protein ABB37_05014 [Leptomonas pyrrhocoris]
MPPNAKRVLSRRMASPITYGTFLLRVSLAVVIVLSAVAIMIYVVAAGVDQVYRLRNQHNIYYAPSNDPTGSTQLLLLPQFDATVGLVTACVSHSCFARAGRSGVQDLIAATLGNQSFTAGDAANLRKRLESEFMFGYDSGAHCGVPYTKLQRLSGFGYAAYVLSLVFFIGLFISSLLLCQLVGDTDVLAGTPSLDKDSNAINVEDMGITGVYLMYKLRRYLSHEGPLLATVMALSGLAFVFSICGMGVTLAAELSSSKCGVSVCTSFESSMRNFFSELARLNIAVSAPRTYSCRTGASLALSLVGFILGLLCFCVACLLAGWYRCTHRRKELLDLRDHLFRLADVQGQIDTVVGGDTPFPLALSRQVSRVVSGGSAAASLGGRESGVERDANGNLTAHHRGASTVSVGTRKSNSGIFGLVEFDRRHARSVGALIELYRALKLFVTTEERARQGLMAQERLEFYSALAMREAMWYNEELCVLHEFTLNWFVGPPLDLSVLETEERQRIMEEFSASVSDFLTNIAGGFDDPAEPVLSWERGGPLSTAATARWSQQVARWQRIQAKTAPLILQSASYARVDTPQPPSRLQKTKSALKLAPVSSLDTDRWLTILDKLRFTTYDDGAFITRSASPFLTHRDTSTLGNFDDVSSFSSNTFSDPSFARAHHDDFIPPDNVRAHLVKAAHTTRTLPRPPPRLRALPPSEDEKRPAIVKGGTGRQLHSGTNGGVGNGSSSRRPGG